MFQVGASDCPCLDWKGVEPGLKGFPRAPLCSPIKDIAVEHGVFGRSSFIHLLNINKYLLCASSNTNPKYGQTAVLSMFLKFLYCTQKETGVGGGVGVAGLKSTHPAQNSRNCACQEGGTFSNAPGSRGQFPLVEEDEEGARRCAL